jgi:SAM-dependent methyltransferase
MPCRMSDPHWQALLNHWTDSLRTGTFVHLHLGNYQGTEPDLRQLRLRRVDLRGGPRLSCVRRYRTRDLTANHPLDAGPALLAAASAEGFAAAHLATTAGDWELSLLPNGKTRLRRLPARQTVTPPTAHDRAPQRLITEAAPFLHALGVVDADGKVAPSMGDKFRQVVHFASILHSLATSTEWPAGKPRRLYDMGCGKGVLTFAAWHLFHHVLHNPLQVFGVEQRPELVAAANRTAQALPAPSLEFVEGSIVSHAVADADIVIALHACNTATDEALAAAVASGARLIIAAPCCHQELRPQLRCPPAIDGLLEDGIVIERMAELVTDRLRCLLLACHGYKTRQFEFIDAAHTHKNTMIAAQWAPSPARTTAARATYDRLTAAFDIRQFALARLL